MSTLKSQCQKMGKLHIIAVVEFRELIELVEL